MVTVNYKAKNIGLPLQSGIILPLVQKIVHQNINMTIDAYKFD